MLSQKGHIHLYAVAGIALLLFIGYGLFNKFLTETPDKSSDGYESISYGQKYGETAQEGPESDQRLNAMLHEIAETQSRLLQIKVKCITLSWPSLDNNARFRILRSFRADTERQHTQVLAFLNRFSSTTKSSDKRRKYLAEVMQSISDDQENLIKFIDDSFQTD